VTVPATITREGFGALAVKYGCEFDPKTSTVTIGSTAHPVTWTKRGHIAPRAPVWRAMRSTPAFARDFPLKAARKQAGAASSETAVSAPDPVALVQSPDFWAGLLPADIDQARQAMDAGARLARERAAEKLRQQYADLRRQAEALGLKLPPLQ
jgi:hypothetical protein